MLIGKIIGHVVSTKKDERLVGQKLLIVQPQLTTNSHISPTTIVAVDSVGAGIGEMVICLTGSSARTVMSENCPVDAAIVGIIDSFEMVN